MLYNIHYEVCSLLFLTVLLVHFLVKRNIRSFNNRFFMIFIACGMLDLILDIASSVMISFHYMFREWQLQLVVGGLFVFQLVIPYMLYLYVLNLCNRLKAQYKKSVLLNTIPFFLMAFLVLTNVHSGLLFTSEMRTSTFTVLFTTPYIFTGFTTSFSPLPTPFYIASK